ncbi:hypothetical protein T484DRAFT_1763204, partial [Baffinella frigidus]
EPTGLATLADHFHASEPSNLVFLALLRSGALHTLCVQVVSPTVLLVKEPSNLVFLALLRSGALHTLCVQSDERKWEAVASDLLVTFSFLFARHRIHPDRATDEAILKSARGKVVLPALPSAVADVVKKYNGLALRVASALASSAAASLPPQADTHALPLSGRGYAAAAAPRVESIFAGMSGGAPSQPESGPALIHPARPDLHLHATLVPVLPLASGDGGDEYLSSYPLDFYTHEQLHVVCNESGMSSGAAWQGLRNLQLTLASAHKAIAAMAPADDALLKAVGRLETEFSAKFYARLYK